MLARLGEGGEPQAGETREQVVAAAWHGIGLEHDQRDPQAHRRQADTDACIASEAHHQAEAARGQHPSARAEAASRRGIGAQPAADPAPVFGARRQAVEGQARPRNQLRLDPLDRAVAFDHVAGIVNAPRLGEGDHRHDMTGGVTAGKSDRDGRHRYVSV